MTEEQLRIRLGQRLAVGFDGYSIPEEYKNLIREYKIGNVILFRRNVGSYAQLRSLCAELRQLILEETGYEPFITIDEECGSVSRLAPIAGQTPCAMAIGSTNEPKNAYYVGKIIGDNLRALGINFDLAPDLDCFTNPDNSVCGNRCFAKEPEKVAAFGVEYVHGLQEANVMACGKHFPGHGDTAVDSHLSLPLVDQPLDVVRNRELVSFRAAIEAGVDGIMSAHVVFPAIEPERVPSTVSRRVMTGLLREEMGFDGIIVSDGMEMNAVMSLFGIEEATRRALAAGVDMALICHSAEQAASASRYLYQAAQEGRLDTKNIEEHFQRIIQRKAALPTPECKEKVFGNEAQRVLSRLIMLQAVQVLHAPENRELPGIDKDALFFGVPARAASNASDEAPLDAAALCAEAFGGKRSEIPANEEIIPQTAVAILGRHADQEACMEAIRRLAERGTQVIAVSMTTPRCLDFLPDTVWKVGAWQYDELAVDALINLLKHH